MVKSPCSESWDEMVGNDVVRFCSHCAKDVTNISEMTPTEATKFVKNSNGNICIRLIKSSQDAATHFEAERIPPRRLLPVLASGLVAATLTLPIAAQTPTEASAVNVSEIVRDESQPKQAKLISLTGKLTLAEPPVNEDGEVDEDYRDHVWFGNIVRLINNETGDEILGDIEDETYYFTDVPAGFYELRIEGDYQFKKKIVLDVPIYANYTTIQDVKMSPHRGNVFTTGWAMGGVIALPKYQTKLVEAIEARKIDDVRKLLYAGANPNGREEHFGNASPLFFAVENGDLEVVKLLLKFGADVNLIADGDTPISRLNGRFGNEILKLLIAYGANINRVDSDGTTPLLEMASSGDAETLKILFDNGVDLAVSDKDGNNALLRAAAADKLGNLEYLLELGFDINSKNNEGNSSIDLTNSKKIETLLESFGAKYTNFDYAAPAFTVMTEDDIED